MVRTILLVVALVAVQCAAPAGEATDDFVLHERIGRTWRNEAVRFVLTPAQAAQAAAGRALLGPDGAAVPYQAVAGQPAAIEFMTDLEPYERRAYRFGAGAASAATDLVWSEDAGAIRVRNGRTGIAIRKQLAAKQGPVEGMLLTSGKWVGGSALKPSAATYAVTVTARGPVFAEIRCDATFADSGTWRIAFRLNANEPVVLVDEGVPLRNATFSLSLSENFAPDRLFFRQGKTVPAPNGEDWNVDTGTNRLWEISKPNTIFLLEPWLRWGDDPPSARGQCFSVFNAAGNDLLSIAARNASSWALPGGGAGIVEAKHHRHKVRVDFTPLPTAAVRKWMITALAKDVSVPGTRDLAMGRMQAPPTQYLIKHGHFPLDVVKDWVLHWQEGERTYPRLLVTRELVDRFRARLKPEEQAAFAAQIPGFLAKPLDGNTVTDPVLAYFMTNDARLARYLADEAVKMVQHSVDTFLVQPDEPYGSKPHHHYWLGSTPLLLDAALGTGLIAPEARKRLMAQLAFVGHAINRPDYWSPERGFAGTPNMTAVVNNYRLLTACTIPSHPLAKGWVDAAITRMVWELDNYSDANGGWLEAPNYAVYAYDQILSALVMTRNAGLNDHLFTNPKVKAVARWLAKTSTPPDSRAGGRRHLPAVGNTHIYEPTGEFGLLAVLFKDQDPAFSAEMRWMHRQHGSFPAVSIGGADAGFPGYRRLLTDWELPERAPAYGSELFPGAGVLLRSGFPDPRETQLHLLAGSFGGNRSHWDDDSGSFTFWGRGRIVCDDFGYCADGAANGSELHSMVDGPGSKAARIFDVQDFAAQPHLDYVNGTRGPWRRQIAFVKDADPAQPSYALVRDTTAEAGVLRLWFTAAKVTPRADGALVEGREDVDTDVYFLTPRAPGELAVAERTMLAMAMLMPDGGTAPGSTTQLSLATATPAKGATAFLLYPRLKSERAPVVTPFAEGRAVKVVSAAGTDWLFLADTPFTAAEGDVSFTGTVGSVRLRGTALTLTLGAGGRLAARGASLESGKPTAKDVVPAR